MEIFIESQGHQAGPFTPQQIQAGLASGHYQTTTLVWHEGLSGWQPISSVPEIFADTPPLPAPMPPNLILPAPNSPLAIASLVLALSSLICGLTAIPAIICGHLARRRIKDSGNRIGGSGLALAGLIIGYSALVLVTVATIAGLVAPLVIRSNAKGHQSEASSHAREIGLLLTEFSEDFGRYPSATTAQLVAEQTDTPQVSGDSSNARFRQLFRAGVATSESTFLVKWAKGQKPDELTSGDQALAPGETGFAYIDNIRTDDGVPRPLVMAPFKPSSTEFDSSPFSGNAVILWSDGSVRSLPINRSSGVVEYEGENLLAPDHPVWGGVPPNLLLPE